MSDDLSSRERIRFRHQAIREIQILKDRKGFLKAGTSNYNRLFGRDALISSWQLLDWNPGICKATLQILSQEQGKIFHDEREEEPGKILHETDFELKWHPEGYFPFPYYGAVDSTPLFLIISAYYFNKTNDRKFLESQWEHILMALHWMEESGDKDFFLEYEKKNPTGLYHQGWKDAFRDHLQMKAPIALVEVQGYEYAALIEIAHLADIKKDGILANKLRDRALRLKAVFNEKFWMEDKQFFALGLDGDKNQRTAITSNPGRCLFTGIIEDQKVEDVVKRIFEDDMWTLYGIRTLSTKDPDFDPKSDHLGSVWPHDNWIIAQGLQQIGYKEEYNKIKNAILQANRTLGKLPELYSVDQGKISGVNIQSHYPQAWASGVLLNFVGPGNVAEKIIAAPSKFFWR